MPQAETYDEYIGWFDDLTSDDVARVLE